MKKDGTGAFDTKEGAFSSMMNLFPVSKTLAFSLVPVGKTRETIAKNNVLENAQKMAEDYVSLKEPADRIHKRFIEDVLSKLHLKYLSDGNGDSIQEYADLYYSNEDKKKLKAVADKLKDAVGTAFASVKYNGKMSFREALKSEALVKDLIAGETLSDRQTEALDRMRKYTTYMRPYFTIRDRMYDAKADGYTISNRIVDDNLPVLLNNRKLYETLPEDVKDGLSDVFDRVSSSLPWAFEVGDLFTVSAAACMSAQSAIDAYNTVIGGIALESGEKIQGLNEKINLHNQALPKDKSSKKIPHMKKIKKQILSDSNTPSWVLEAIENDFEVVTKVRDLHKVVLDSLLPSRETMSRIARNTELEGVQVDAKRLNEFSHAICGDWQAAKYAILDVLYRDYPIKKKEKPEKYEERIGKIFKDLKAVNARQIYDAITAKYEDVVLKTLPEYVDDVFSLLDEAEETYSKLDANVKDASGEGYRLEEESKSLIHSWLGLVMDAKHMMDVFVDEPSEGVVDVDFYGMCCGPVSDISDVLIPVFNKVRNYLTKKPYSTDKLRLYFGSPVFLGGWARSKDTENRGILIRDGNDKYLAVLPPQSKKLFDDERIYDASSRMQRMELNYIPGAAKTLPRIGFSNEATPSERVLAIRRETENGTKEVADYDSREVGLMVDYYKSILHEDPKWKAMTFKATPDYKKLNDFYVDVDRQGYQISWVGLSRPFIERAVERGDLYLFRITCQDMSPAHHGVDGNYKALLDEAFSDRNVTDTMIRILGGAAVYYREASLPEKVTHPRGIPMANKNPNNPRGSRTLPYDLIKDRRYTREHFALHLPVEYMPESKKLTGFGVSEMVRETVKENPGMYVLGINRGERNLVSIAVTAPDGKIVEQRHLNVFNGFDYRRKLATLEKERNDDRRDWKSIRTIKDVKAGYLSRVIGEIVRLVKKYNCVIALENLDLEFKQGRQQFEKNVYQQFERDLVGRLSCLMDKNDADRTRTTLQMTFPGKNIEDRTKFPQNGIVFFVSPSWITKTDPLTGFASRLNTHYESIEKAEKMISAYESFRYLPDENIFALSFSFAKTTPNKEAGDGRVWTVYTNGVRTEMSKPDKDKVAETKPVVLTAKMKDLLEKDGIRYEDGKDILDKLHGRSATFYQKFFNLLRLTLQNVYWNESEGVFKLVSCTKGPDGKFYDSDTAPGYMPKDPDANAAWNVARKAHMVLNNIREFRPGVTLDSEGKKAKGPRMVVSDAEWFRSVQK